MTDREAERVLCALADDPNAWMRAGVRVMRPSPGAITGTVVRVLRRPGGRVYGAVLRVDQWGDGDYVFGTDYHRLRPLEEGLDAAPPGPAS